MSEIILLTDPTGKALENAPPGLGFSILSSNHVVLEADYQTHLVVREEALHANIKVLGALSHLEMDLKIEYIRSSISTVDHKPRNSGGLLYLLRRTAEDQNFAIPRIILVGWSLDEARDYVDKVYGIHLVHDLTYCGGWLDIDVELLHEKATIRNQSILEPLTERLSASGSHRFRIV